MSNIRSQDFMFITSHELIHLGSQDPALGKLIKFTQNWRLQDTISAITRFVILVFLIISVSPILYVLMSSDLIAKSYTLDAYVIYLLVLCQVGAVAFVVLPREISKKRYEKDRWVLAQDAATRYAESTAGQILSAIDKHRDELYEEHLHNLKMDVKRRKASL